MACGKGTVQLSPTEKEIGQTIEHEFLSVEQIAEKTGLPLFKVRSGIRALKKHDLLIEENDTYKINKEDE